MSFRNPDVEIHATGWPAILVGVILVSAVINSFLRLISLVLP